MRISVIVRDDYGKRIVDALKKYGPDEWQIEETELKQRLPMIIDEPEEFIPENLPETDLILFLCQDSETIQLLPSIAKKTDTKGVIVAIDRPDWLEPGFQMQIEKELIDSDIDYVFARPLCSLTESDSNNKFIKEFARYFGMPEFRIKVVDGMVENVEVKRGSPCGCSWFVAENLKGVKVTESVEKAGLLHHNYPCMASMQWDNTLGETIMHVAGYKTKNAVRDALE